MDSQNPSSGGGNSDKILQTKKADSPEPICVSTKRTGQGKKERSLVSMISDASVGLPPDLSDVKNRPSLVSMKSGKEKDPSLVSMKSDASVGLPPNLSHERREPSLVSMKSDASVGLPPNLSHERRESSLVSMKSDASVGLPPNLSHGRRESSHVLKKRAISVGLPPDLSDEQRDTSLVSMKSDASVGLPPDLSDEQRDTSLVSMKSDASVGLPPDLWGEEKETNLVRIKSSWKREPSHVSMKRAASVGLPPDLSDERRESSHVLIRAASVGLPPDLSDERKESSHLFIRAASVGLPPDLSDVERRPSCVRKKSDASVGLPPDLSDERKESSHVLIRAASVGLPPDLSDVERRPSCVRKKSDASVGLPPDLSDERKESSHVLIRAASVGLPPDLSDVERRPSCVRKKSDASVGLPPDLSDERKESSHVLIRAASVGLPPDLSYVERRPSCVRKKSDASVGLPPDLSGHDVSFDSKQLEEREHIQSVNALQKVLAKHKTCMKSKYESLFEGIKTEENKTLLNRIYTQLYIIEGESEGVNEEHEVLQMEKKNRKHFQDSPINCSDIFKPLQGTTGRIEDDKLKAVLTNGIAGIGKTVSVQKFILDWAEGKANQDVDFMFVLPFREMNLIKDDQYSLHGLLCDFHPELKDLDPKIYSECKTVFIFDGLDESRIPLNFSQCKKVSDVTTSSSVGVLMTNLIRGDLLPSALIWITSRPAAANQIPPEYINRMTEIQGFNDPQKEEYFSKRITDQEQAQKIISHIKTTKSLHIMCHIPVFCWISATVLQEIIKQHDTEIPKTLTEMYSHFLITQTNKKIEKYEDKDEKDPKKQLESNRTMLLKLAELAFKQLMKGNVMFYEEDLRESGIDVTEASVYSGILTEIFKEESVLYQRKIYCFVHLSFQEFLAAVYVFYCYENKKSKELQTFKPHTMGWSENITLDELLKGVIQKASKSQNGHLDIFLRFLLGISMESNQRLLQGLLTNIHSRSEETQKYIKELIKKDDEHISTDRSINLFLCLSEMNDQSLSREIQEYLKSEKHSEEWLSPGQCSALAYMLLNSEEELDEINLKKFNTSEEGYRRLIPVVSICRKAILADCELIKDSCGTICSALQSANRSLKELDLRNNHLQDSGVDLISTGLKSSHCNLEILRLATCKVGRGACQNLASVLQSANSTLKELDLSNNKLQDSGVKLLSVGLMTSHCKLEVLRLATCNLGEKACEHLGSALQSENTFLKELDLSNNDLQDSGVNLISAGLRTSQCKLEILRLIMCNLRKEACEHLGSALQSENNSLIELDLSNNDLQDSGVKLISAGLKSFHCNLETLRLSGCMVTDEGCSSLASALKSNPSHLREIDLTYNHLREFKVNLLSDLCEDPHYKLEKVLVEHGGEIRMTPGLKKYACELTLDPNTVNHRLCLSDRNRRVKRRREPQLGQTPEHHPERFDYCRQVLCKESLSGRCYWEAEWVGKEAVIAVAYKGIQRKGFSNDSLLGYNNQSWSLFCSDDGYTVRHKNPIITLPPSHSRRVGVYLDFVAGDLSFYSVSPNKHTPIHSLTDTFAEHNTHTLTHLYTLHCTFTEALYAGFRVYFAPVYLCDKEDLLRKHDTTENTQSSTHNLFDG